MCTETVLYWVLLYTRTTFDSLSSSLLVLSGAYRSIDTQHVQVRNFLDGDSHRFPLWVQPGGYSFLGFSKDPTGHCSPGSSLLAPLEGGWVYDRCQFYLSCLNFFFNVYLLKVRAPCFLKIILCSHLKL